MVQKKTKRKKRATKTNRCKFCNRSCDGKYCSESCEISHLRSRLSTADKKIARHEEKRQRGAQCLARVEWEWCCQEWYLKDTYDAKRRACELRHKGFECSAKSVGEMPLDDGKGGITIAKVTVVTIHYRENEKGEILIPPKPTELIGGLREGA